MSRVSPLHLAVSVLTGHLLSSRQKPFLASYKLTYLCNLRCQQCAFVDLPCENPSFDQVCATLDQLRERGNRVVILEGGEPLLWRDGQRRFADVAAAARERFAVVGATTNGTLPLDSPTDVLWVSVDGLHQTHNRLRGSPVFDLVVDHIRRSRHPRLFAHTQPMLKTTLKFQPWCIS